MATFTQWSSSFAYLGVNSRGGGGGGAAASFAYYPEEEEDQREEGELMIEESAESFD